MFEKARYTASLRRLHWLMAVMIALAYLAIEQRNLFERGTPERFAMVQSHFWLGIGIFVLVWVRLQQRLKHGAPRITPALPGWQNGISHLMHVALYAFFIVMPILGMLTAWTDGKAILIPFTDIALPALLAENKDLAHQLEELHHDIGEAFYWVIGFHIVAALYHHFIRKDDTLVRMR
ncbi:cytochrome b [Arenimonas maotaiensis]|uniref:Cytochrome b n=1 Tax=Arenimonas maotaiensis TaxID=1446479 RepID=A0A917CTY7_9GAMM|nr:cytochrome b [Arenimonas maotaiensis]GGF95959.1 cytochrome b [Arenimonas maotaiensis]